MLYFSSTRSRNYRVPLRFAATDAASPVMKLMCVAVCPDACLFCISSSVGLLFLFILSCLLLLTDVVLIWVEKEKFLLISIVESC